jgi:hypothetical protein
MRRKCGEPANFVPLNFRRFNLKGFFKAYLTTSLKNNQQNNQLSNDVKEKRE